MNLDKGIVSFRPSEVFFETNLFGEVRSIPPGPKD